MGLLDGFLALGADTNKIKHPDEKPKEGIQKESLELTLDMDDDKLIKLAKNWEQDWMPYRDKWEKRYKKNERYWLGRHYSEAEMQLGNVAIDNKIFESIETLLPATTSRNPEPLVSAEDTEEGKKLEKSVGGMLIHQSDRLRLKKRLKKVTRHWIIYLQGVIKVGWSMKNNDISSPVIHPTKLILDPSATIDDDMNYTGYYIGEWLEGTASELIQRFPNKKVEIMKEAQGKSGSKMKYTEWWTDDYMFWRMKDIILDKAKNPHWNEDTEQEVVDDMGNKTMQVVPARNHFGSKEKPYVFLSVLSLGKHPHDDTGLIEQAIPMQEITNKRQKQIDKNVEDMNGGWIISMERSGLNKEQASQAVDAIRKGGALVAPTGAAQDVAHRIIGTGLPADVFNNLNDTRNEISKLFGVAGSTPSGIREDRTVEGKKTIRAQDESRNGTLIEALEQFSDKVFNWWVQLMYVHYDELHAASIIGANKSKEYIALKSDMLDRKLTVTVKEGSLVPKDPMEQAIQAEELFKLGALDPITLFDKLGFSNPIESAKKLWMWQNDPTSFFAGDPKVDEILKQKSLAAQEEEIKQAHIMDQEHQNDVELVAAQAATKAHTSVPKPTTKGNQAKAAVKKSKSK